MKPSMIILAICVLLVTSFAGCQPSSLPTPSQLIPKDTSTPVLIDAAIPSFTLTPIPTAVTKAEIPCYDINGDYRLTVFPYVVVDILGRDNASSWAYVRVNEITDCWADASLLKYDDKGLGSAPIVDAPTPQIPSATTVPIPTDTPIVMTATPPLPLLIRWKIVSYDCSNGRATGATISLDISGGIPSEVPGGFPGSAPDTDPRYTYFPKLPIYALPEQSLSITVYSATADGEPSETIQFKVPRASDKNEFNCPKEKGNNPLPPPPPTDDPPPPTQPPSTEPPPKTEPPPSTEPPPTEPAVCYNPQGHVIPCHDH